MMPHIIYLQPLLRFLLPTAALDATCRLLVGAPHPTPPRLALCVGRAGHG